MKKIILLLILVLVSCQYEDYDDFKEPKPKPVVLDYKVSFDVIRHYSDLQINFTTLNYYPNCGYDTTHAMADFDLDGDIDILLAPLCDDGQGRQPEIAIFLNNDGVFTKSEANISNNIGLFSGTRQTIVGDYNGDKIPDVFFASHGGHGLDGGLPTLLVSKGLEFEYIELDIGLGWYAFASSGDIDGDGDLDILLSGRENGTFINNGSAEFTYSRHIMDNYTGNIGVTSLVDINGDKALDLFYRSVDEHNYVLNVGGKFDYLNRKVVSYPSTLITDIAVDLDIQDRVFYDLDKDKDLDIITVSMPHDQNTSPLGQFYMVEVFINDNGVYTDKTKELIDENISSKYIEWLRLYDLDKDNLIELFDNSSFYREWNGYKFVKQNLED